LLGVKGENKTLIGIIKRTNTSENKIKGYREK